MIRPARALLIGAIPLALLAGFFLLPLAYVLLFALGLDSATAPTTTWAELATNAYHRNRILFTFQQAALSTALTLAVGLPAAYLFAHHEFPGRRVLRALFTVPFVLPALVVALAFQSLLGRGSPLGLDVLAALGPLGAILLAHTFYNVSLVLRIVGSVWERMPPELVESARTLGAARWQRLRHVHLPVAAPAILAASALTFLFSLSSFGIILLLGSGTGTLETLIWDNVQTLLPRYDRAAWLGLLQVATSLAALATYLHYRKRTLTTWRPRTQKPRTPLPASGAAFLSVLTLFLVGPLVALATAAFRHAGAWSLDGFRLLFDAAYPLGSYTATDAILNSLRFGLLSMLLVVPLAVLALLALRSAGRARTFAETILLLPLGASPVLVGLGFLLAYDGQPLWDLRAHPARIILAHALVGFPFVTRILAPSLEAIDPTLREAARTLGAQPVHVFLRLDLPLVWPALRVAALFGFATSLGEFGATLLLRRPETTTIPLAIFDAVSRPGAAYRAQAEVLTFLLLAVATLAFLLLERTPRSREVELA